MKKILLGLLGGLLILAQPALAQKTLRVAVHNSFALPSSMLEAFEKDNQVKVSIVKMGDSGEMLNKLILTKAKPVADVVYGLDNASVFKAQQAGILAPVQPKMNNPARAQVPYAVSIDYAYVTINYDKAWFKSRGLALPKTLNDLTLPQYKNLLVMPNPATSSPGLAFLMANIEGWGEERAFAWWAKMRANGVKVSKGWSEAYYTEFTQNGGSRPLVVSYASSPAAEVFFSKKKLTESPTGNLFLGGGTFRQIEAAAVLKGSQNVADSQAFIAFLRDKPVQTAMQTQMWVYPVNKNVLLVPEFRFAQLPKKHSTPNAQTMSNKQKEWVSQWTRIVLR